MELFLKMLAFPGRGAYSTPALGLTPILAFLMLSVNFFSMPSSSRKEFAGRAADKRRTRLQGDLTSSCPKAISSRRAFMLGFALLSFSVGSEAYCTPGYW